MRYFIIYVVLLIFVLLSISVYNTTRIETFQSAYTTDYDIESDEDLQKLFSGMYTFLSRTNSISTSEAMNDCVRIRECASLYINCLGPKFETETDANLKNKFPKTFSSSSDINMLKQMIYASKQIANTLTFNDIEPGNFSERFPNFGTDKPKDKPEMTKTTLLNPPYPKSVDNPYTVNTQCDASVENIRKPLMSSYKMVYQSLAYFQKLPPSENSTYPGDKSDTKH